MSQHTHMVVILNGPRRIWVSQQGHIYPHSSIDRSWYTEWPLMFHFKWTITSLNSGKEKESLNLFNDFIFSVKKDDIITLSSHIPLKEMQAFSMLFWIEQVFIIQLWAVSFLIRIQKWLYIFNRCKLLHSNRRDTTCWVAKTWHPWFIRKFKKVEAQQAFV